MVRRLVEKSIHIDAPAAKVWKVLTEPGLTRQWARQCWPGVERIESDWRLGDPVVWRAPGGAVGALGRISAIQRPVRLTVEVRDPAVPEGEQQVTYRLNERLGHTQLSVTVGDFADEPAATQPAGAGERWDRSLPKIKELSEKS